MGLYRLPPIPRIKRTSRRTVSKHPRVMEQEDSTQEIASQLGLKFRVRALSQCHRTTSLNVDP